MHEVLQSSVQELLRQNDLSSQQVRESVGVIMDGACDAIDIAAFLTAMAAKGPAVAEVVGAAQAMRDRCSRITTLRAPLLDTCGTGGDCLHTFNISTATAIVAAACGVNVAKHGNRSVSSSSGSADVLEALGVQITLSAEAAGRCLDEIGIAFCFAPVVHGAMKHAAPVRRQLGFPTIFNLLGPLTNPAAAEYQILGANSIQRAELLASALAQLGTQHAFVVCGNGELDEVCLWGPTTVFEVALDRVHQTEWQPEDFGLKRCDVNELQVNSVSQSASIIRGVLQGSDSAATRIVAANAAAALLVANKVTNLKDGVQAALNALSSGKASSRLHQLTSWENS